MSFRYFVAQKRAVQFVEHLETMSDDEVRIVLENIEPETLMMIEGIMDTIGGLAGKAIQYAKDNPKTTGAALGGLYGLATGQNPLKTAAIGTLGGAALGSPTFRNALTGDSAFKRTITGAGLGALGGSLVPGIGTVPGAGLGALGFGAGGSKTVRDALMKGGAVKRAFTGAGLGALTGLMLPGVDATTGALVGAGTGVAAPLIRKGIEFAKKGFNKLTGKKMSAQDLRNAVSPAEQQRLANMETMKSNKA
jgi:hypothetical protein